MNNEDRQKEYDARLAGILPEARAYVLAHNEGLQKAIDYCFSLRDETMSSDVRFACRLIIYDLQKILIKDT